MEEEARYELAQQWVELARRYGESEEVIHAALGHHDDLRIGIAADEVIGTYSVNTEDLLEQAPENVPHCVGMLRHDDRLALGIDLRRLLEVFPGPSI